MGEVKSGPGKSTKDIVSEANAVKTKYGDKCCASEKHQGSGKKLGKK